MSRLHRIEAAFSENQSAYIRRGAGELAEFGPLSALFVGAGLPVNGGFGRTDQDETQQRLPELETFCLAHEFPPALTVFSHAPATLLTALAQRRYQLDYLLHTYARSMQERVPDPALQVEEVTPDEWSEGTPLAFGPGSHTILRLGAEQPDVVRLGVKQDGAWAGFAALSLHDIQNGKVALLFSAGTLPKYRGRGVQTALLAARLQRAQAAGADLASVMVTPGSVSERNVVRSGFGMVGARLRFVQSQPSS